MVGWFCLLAPARTPAPVIEKLNREVVRVMREPAMIKKTYAAGNEPYVTTPAETREYMTAQLALYRKVVEIAGARAV
ncbi:MAG: tripartite tricarboxylate transporter substrate-binding protein [Burkholderiaceae bacterium]